MQFERALARKVFSAEYLQRIENWQEDTEADATGEALGRLKTYRHCAHWKRGFALCRELGVLDARNRPTWSFPDWSTRAKKDWKKLHDSHCEGDVS